MWNIFANDDLSLHVEKKEEENVAKQIKKKKVLEKGNHKNGFTKTGSPGSSFTKYNMKIRELRKNFRKKYRIVRTQLLKLTKIVKQFPQIANDDIEIEGGLSQEKSSGNNDGEDVTDKVKTDETGEMKEEISKVKGEKMNSVKGEKTESVKGEKTESVKGEKMESVKEDVKGKVKSVMVSAELVKKLHKIIDKIDVEKLGSKKKIKKKIMYKDEEEPFKNKLLKRNLSNKSFMVPPKNDSYKSNANIMKKKHWKQGLLQPLNDNFKNSNQQNAYEHSRMVYKNNFRNNYNHYEYFQNRKHAQGNFYNDTDDMVVTDFYMHSTINASFSRPNSTKNGKKMVLQNGDADQGKNVDNGPIPDSGATAAATSNFSQHNSYNQGRGYGNGYNHGHGNYSYDHNRDHGNNYGYDHNRDHGNNYSYDHNHDHGNNYNYDHNHDHGNNYNYDHNHDHINNQGYIHGYNNCEQSYDTNYEQNYDNNYGNSYCQGYDQNYGYSYSQYYHQNYGYIHNYSGNHSYGHNGHNNHYSHYSYHGHQGQQGHYDPLRRGTEWTWTQNQNQNQDKGTKGGNYKNESYTNNYNSFLPSYSPQQYVGNATDGFHSSEKMASLERKKTFHLYNKKKVNKFVKDEKIRGLLRTAANEHELLKAINFAKNAGLHFEATLGDKKLNKLKLED
ncbi:conserved Plasmodium protein, unknown function [Plasmodium ovale wallikeri]|uniref:Uncharacterized protein n=1 Tax=Plasmodium ovale wallikeri TaxID=864142 RepID=A0A1A8YL13_PLAOA|nr:conserved Plasmodium protein, unknown function [Plasmodium ovale wallikeri]